MASPPPPRRTAAGWPSFLILSLLLHLIFLWLIAASPAMNRTAADSFTIQLKPTATTEAAPHRSEPATKQPLSPSAAASPQQQESAPDAVSPAATRAGAAAIIPTVTTFDEARFTGNSASFGQNEKITLRSEEKDTAAPMVRAQLLTRFAEHFHYPLLAQQRNWQGVVVLSFRVERNGTLQGIQVAVSSGIDVLDRAAVESLHAIGQLEFAPGTLLHDSLELRLPVVYHLAQG